MAVIDTLNELRTAALDFETRVRAAQVAARDDLDIPEGSVVIPLSFLQRIGTMLEDLSEGDDAYIEGLPDPDFIAERIADNLSEAIRSAISDALPYSFEEDASIADGANPYDEAEPIRDLVNDAVTRFENGSLTLEDRAIDSL